MLRVLAILAYNVVSSASRAVEKEMDELELVYLAATLRDHISASLLEVSFFPGEGKIVAVSR